MNTYLQCILVQSRRSCHCQSLPITYLLLNNCFISWVVNRHKKQNVSVVDVSPGPVWSLVCHGAGLPDGEGRVSAHQLLQLQLLVLHGLVHRRAALPPLEGAWQAPAAQGAPLVARTCNMGSEVILTDTAFVCQTNHYFAKNVYLFHVSYVWSNDEENI